MRTEKIISLFHVFLTPFWLYVIMKIQLYKREKQQCCGCSWSFFFKSRKLSCMYIDRHQKMDTSSDFRFANLKKKKKQDKRTEVDILLLEYYVVIARSVKWLVPSDRIWPERGNLDSLIYVGTSSCTVRSHISTVMFCMLQLIASRTRTTNKALKILRSVTELSHLPFVRAWLLGCCYITVAASTASLASCLWIKYM